MKGFLENVKDIIYDSIDYIIMFSIIIGVVFVIGWRLDVLFANDALDIPTKNNVEIVDKTPPIKDSNEDKDIVKDKVPDEEVVEEPEDDPLKEEPADIPSNQGELVNITIPAGSLPSKIGSILESNGLVSSKGDFVKKAQELKLDTKLKSGKFTIANNISIEEVLKIITK